MTQWVRSYWAEGDVTYHLEIDGDGWVIRQVEWEGPSRRVAAAASLTEWQRELAAGRISQYQTRYGGLADQPTSEWDPDWPREAITQEEFERVWQAARAECERR